MNRADAHALQLYLRTHRGLTFACGASILVVFLALSMRTSRGITSWDGASSTPISIATLAGLGILGASTWSNRGGQHEDSLTTRLPTLARRLHPLVLTFTSCVLAAAVTGATFTSFSLSLVAARTVVLWSSLAFLGATTGRVHLVWGLPVTYFLAMGTMGYALSGAPHWWNVPMQPLDNPMAWALSTAVAVIAGLFVWRTTQ